MHIITSEQERLKPGFEGYSCNRGTDTCSFSEIKGKPDEILIGFLYGGVMNSDVRVFNSSVSSEVSLSEGYANKCPCCPDHAGDDTSFNPLILANNG